MHHPLPIHFGYVYLADLVPKTSRIFMKNINAPTSTTALIRIRVSIEVNSSPARLPDHSGDVPATRLVKIAHCAKFNSLAKSLYAAFGLVADLCIGIIGAFSGNCLLPRLRIHLGFGILAAIISATIGAVLLLVILRLVNRRGRW
jgi:uncharacterized membrane protein YeaQ/YmgE (transglycosylase-associated protein family)